MFTIGLVLSIITLFMVVMADIIEWLKDKIKEKKGGRYKKSKK